MAVRVLENCACIAAKCEEPMQRRSESGHGENAGRRTPTAKDARFPVKAPPTFPGTNAGT